MSRLKPRHKEQTANARVKNKETVNRNSATATAEGNKEVTAKLTNTAGICETLPLFSAINANQCISLFCIFHFIDFIRNEYILVYPSSSGHDKASKSMEQNPRTNEHSPTRDQGSVRAALGSKAA